MRVIENIRPLHFLRSAAMILPAALLPCALVGVSVKPAINTREAKREFLRLQELVDYSEFRREQLMAFGDIDRLESVDELSLELHELVPQQPTVATVYGKVRVAGDTRNLTLEAIQFGQLTDLDLVVGSETVGMQQVVIHGTGGLNNTVGLVDELRQHRLPAAPLAFRFARDKPQDREFRFELRLGVFHYMPSATGAAESEFSDTE